MTRHDSDRRTVLQTVVAAAGVAIGAGKGSASHTDEPSITLPGGRALVLERAQGPLEAAVRTRRVYMPDGGWVVVSMDATATDVVGRSIQRLPAGHFERLMVATRNLEPGTYTLYATLFEGGHSAEFPGDGPDGYGWTQDSAEITFE